MFPMACFMMEHEAKQNTQEAHLIWINSKSLKHKSQIKASARIPVIPQAIAYGETVQFANGE
jgi:hypothetical protein